MRALPLCLAVSLMSCVRGAAPAATKHNRHDVVIRGGTIYDGSGGAGFIGDVAIRGDRITYVGVAGSARGKTEIDATGHRRRARDSSTC